MVRCHWCEETIVGETIYVCRSGDDLAYFGKSCAVALGLRCSHHDTPLERVS